MPPTPPSSHGSDSEGSQSPVHPCAPASPTQTPAVLKVAPRAPSSLSSSPLLTAPHVSTEACCSLTDVFRFLNLLSSDPTETTGLRASPADGGGETHAHR